ncbi:hypothetical protein GB931_02950 [Modestobacter sp. I12A-02628]|uniref:SGNH hydrolase-type esterase domain-containing protein n=1 Tax=Goekera deserti TaxID=2497753 RepID=A0A7K3WF98_9ACTN|nr:SGNH/GDSL hydrolase family protein [Goekera deserti]MPQ96896.1 hypothetical protein [Goekera deserti]NDI46791.1 hypothetical protein [Goekera deserti]NEL54360.1 hypothetical protein [Goekera deserti]
MTGTQAQYVGPWLIEPVAGGAALRRSDEESRPGASGPDWDPIDSIPAAGDARRVVVLGESTARGWPFESFGSPTSVLARNLQSAGEFQCIDLAKVGADGRVLLDLAGKLSLLHPDVVVSFAGNNWMMPPATDGRRMDQCADDGLNRRLADALRAGGYRGLKEAATAHAMTAVRAYTEQLVRLHAETGATVVIVVTEYNLSGFAPPPDIQTPVLPGSDLARWHELRRQAQQALASGNARAVARLAAEMIDIDGGCSPVPGWLAGRAAVLAADGRAARLAFEQSRDSVCGLMLRYTPRVTRDVQQLLVDVAAENGFPCVDLRRVLADPDLPDIPDESCFHDYCHLSDTGIERAAAAITDAVLARPAGSTAPGPGLSPVVRAFGHARAAAHLAFQAQPADAVEAHLQAALDLEPGLVPLLRDVRELLSAPVPGWTDPAMARLSEDPQIQPFVGVMTGNPGLTPELWSLRDCLESVLGQSETVASQSQVDLLLPSDPDGHPLPNWTQPWAHHVACSSESVLLFALDGPRDLELTIEFRTPWADPAASVEVGCNSARLAGPEASRSWSTVRLSIAAAQTKQGVNRIRISWPVPRQDTEAAICADADALETGEFPMIVPVFGELYDARIQITGMPA